MANLRNTKDRIQSIKNTQKITRAMKMVAAAKVKKAENAVKMSRPFSLELFRTFVEIYNSIEDKDFEEIKTNNPLDNYPVLLKEREIKTLGLVIVSSNKGLAGAYTANLVRFAAEEIKKANKENMDVKVFLLGQKAESALRALRGEYKFDIKEVYTGVLDDINVSSAKVVASDLAQEYVGWPLLPVIKTNGSEFRAFYKKEFDKENRFEYETFFDKVNYVSEIFEPNQKAILQKIVPMYITNLIFQAILEAQASELASRMTAMSAATNNANDMIETLTIQYNKARQEKITQEITEVVSGSLKK